MTATSHRVASLAVAAAAAFALAAPAQATTVVQGAKIAGSGHLVDAQRKLAPFTTLRIEGPIDVDAHPGANPGAVVHADDNIEPLVETVQEGDTLVVRLRPGASFHTEHDLKVELEFAALARTSQDGSGVLHIHAIDSPKLESHVAGSCDLRIDSAQLGSFSASVAGSGDVKIDGRADTARVAVAGSGDVHAFELVARRVEVSVSGSGNAQVNAAEAIDARVAGSGDVAYRGHPHDVSRHVSGSGSVEAVD